VDDGREFEAFVQARYQAMVRTAALLLGATGQAEDLVQSALLRTYLRWDNLAQRSSAEAYTRTVMVRLALRWGRRRWRGEQPTAALDVVSVDDATEAIDEADEVARLLGRLPATQRAVLVLRYYDQLTEAETAQVLRCRPGTVKSRTARALAALREGGLLVEAREEVGNVR
jgi:RNA polymerase sigma-70 factor (sigma-E family)